MLSPDNYEPPTSAWEIVCQYAAASEHHELKQLIGADLIDQTVELRREIALLQELAMDLSSAAASPAAAAAPPLTRLPEPPQMRERLTQEIVFFLESIRERARRITGSEAVDFKRLAVSQEIVDYAYESSSSRPSTGLSRLSLGEIRVTPCSSRAGSRSGRSAAGLDEDEASAASVAQMRDQLTYMRCDEVRKRLRQYLQDEIEMLKEDLANTQDAVSALPLGPSPDPEIPASASAASLRPLREPSLAELRAERHKLEQVLLSAAPAAATATASLRPNNRLPAPTPDRHSNKPANESIPRPPGDALVASPSVNVRRPSSAQRLRSLVQQNRQQAPPLAANLE